MTTNTETQGTITQNTATQAPISFLELNLIAMQEAAFEGFRFEYKTSVGERYDMADDSRFAVFFMESYELLKHQRWDASARKYGEVKNSLTLGQRKAYESMRDLVAFRAAFYNCQVGKWTDFVKAVKALPEEKRGDALKGMVHTIFCHANNVHTEHEKRLREARVQSGRGVSGSRKGVVTGGETVGFDAEQFAGRNIAGRVNTFLTWLIRNGLPSEEISFLQGQVVSARAWSNVHTGANRTGGRSLARSSFQMERLPKVAEIIDQVAREVTRSDNGHSHSGVAL